MVTLMIISFIIGTCFGWCLADKNTWQNARFAARDEIILQGFDHYREINGEPHPMDPRHSKPKLTVLP
jgi:hypothetical protein